MKQLKFMLAAAAAFGIATAQAAEKTTYLVGTAADAPENFDAANLADQNPVGAIAGYDFQPVAPATAADNESVIKDGALNVNTGTDPLLRALDYQSSVNPVSVTDKSLYINTKVQFTVTPEGDTVDAKTGDKLMIYFKEDLSDAENPKTNLVVKALQFAPESAPGVGDGVAQEITVDTGVGYPTIAPNTWYSLVVTSTAMDLGDGTYLPVFQVKVNDTPLTSGQISLANDGSFDKFPSIQGAVAKPTLTYVGFAGEGKVDDLLVWTVETISSVDFTLTLGTGVSAVTYVIGSADSVKITETKTLEKLEAAKITISAIDYLVGYKAGDNGLGEYDVSADGLTIDAAEVVINDGTAEGSTATTAADLQITNAKFANDSPAQLTKLTTWAKNYSVSLSAVNGMTFADEEVESEAYLLNCAPTAKAVEDAKAAFKFPAITAGEVPAVYEPKEGYNVQPKIFGADSIEALKTSEVPATADHKFFKAVLTK